MKRPVVPWVWGALVALLLLRVPGLLNAPRFLYEEGAVYFASAWSLGPGPALLKTHQGYFALVTNAATILASFVPLAWAPLVSTLVGMLVQLVPVALVLHGRAAVWSRPGLRALGALVTLLLGSGHLLWGSSLAAQYHLSVAGLLVLIEPADAGARRRWIYLAVLALAGLGGPAVFVLLPVFALAAFEEWRAGRGERGKWRVQQALVLVACFLVQLALIARDNARIDGPGAVIGGRFELFGVEPLLGVGVTQLLVANLLGRGTATVLGDWLRESAGGAEAWLVLVVGTLVLVGLCIELARHGREGRTLVLAMLVAFLANTTLSIGKSFGLMNADASPIRYYLLPSTAFALSVVAYAGHRMAMGPPLGTWLARLGCAGLLASGLLSYARPNDLHFELDWQDEVAVWRRGGASLVNVWPPGWTVDLEAERPARESAKREVGPATAGDGAPLLDLQVGRMQYGLPFTLRIEGPPRAQVVLFVQPGNRAEPWEQAGCTYFARQRDARGVTIELPASGVYRATTIAVYRPALSILGVAAAASEEEVLLQAVLPGEPCQASNAWALRWGY